MVRKRKNFIQGGKLVMTYRENLERLAKQSFERFINYIRDDKNLYDMVEESEDEETIIEVFYMGEDEEEFLGRFYFNDNGELLRID